MASQTHQPRGDIRFSLYIPAWAIALAAAGVLLWFGFRSMDVLWNEDTTSLFSNPVRVEILESQMHYGVWSATVLLKSTSLDDHPERGWSIAAGQQQVPAAAAIINENSERALVTLFARLEPGVTPTAVYYTHDRGSASFGLEEPSTP